MGRDLHTLAQQVVIQSGRRLLRKIRLQRGVVLAKGSPRKKILSKNQSTMLWLVNQALLLFSKLWDNASSAFNPDFNTCTVGMCVINKMKNQ